MKMNSTDYNLLKAAIERRVAQYNLSIKEKEAAYKAEGLTEMRFRRDTLYFSGYNVCPMYSYLNDTHIDTALKAIIKELISKEQ